MPAAVSSFKGFYTTSGKFILINSRHNLIALAVLAGLVLIALTLVMVRNIRRRKLARKAKS